MPHYLHPHYLQNVPLCRGRLAFNDSGGAGEPVVLLHGLGSRGSDWQPQVDALAPDYRVITLDFPGHGDSDPLCGPVTMADLAGSVTALLDELHIARVHVVGLSLGGMVAFQLAVDCPQRLRSFTIINSAPGPGNKARRFKTLVALRTALIRLGSINLLARRIARNLFPKPEQQGLREQFLRSMAAVDKQSYLHTIRAIGRFNLDRAITGCAIPALILAAEHDYTPVAFKQRYVARLSNARFAVVPASHHATPLDSPDFCNREINAFLHELSMSPPAAHECHERPIPQPVKKSAPTR